MRSCTKPLSLRERGWGEGNFSGSCTKPLSLWKRGWGRATSQATALSPSPSGRGVGVRAPSRCCTEPSPSGIGGDGSFFRNLSFKPTRVEQAPADDKGATTLVTAHAHRTWRPLPADAARAGFTERRDGVSRSVCPHPNPSPGGRGASVRSGQREDEHPEGHGPHPLSRTSQVIEAAATDAAPDANVRGRSRPGCTVRVGSSALAPRIHCILRPDVRLSAGSRTR